VARAGQLSQPTAPIAPETSNEDVHRLFSEQPQLETLAVVADDRPLGLINRQRFMEQYARPFARDVFGRRTCLVFTDTAPLVVAASLPMDQLVHVPASVRTPVANPSRACATDVRHGQ
jgi:hypothetical protein